MAKKESAGLLMYREYEGEIQFFLVHPGGPFFKKKDEGFWTVPKGEIEEGEHRLESAEREFKEETGINPSGPYHELGTVKQKNGKIVHCWAFQGEWNEEEGIHSNLVPVVWPPKSGKIIKVPEVDKGAWYDKFTALKKINEAQADFIHRLMLKLNLS